MSQTLTLELDDDIYAAIDRLARSGGTTVAGWLSKALRDPEGLLHHSLRAPAALADDARQQAARDRFERHFGEVDLGRPTGVDNVGIDADLARAYADSDQGS
jgi:predicted transcriptional regulator